MKHTKRLLALFLALTLVLSFGITAFAAEGEGETTPSVTINNALKGNTFTLYKIFNLESYIAAEKKYVYTIANASPLYDTVKEMTLRVGSPAEDKLVFTLLSKDENYDYVQLTLNFQNIQDNGDEVKAIAAKLMDAIDKLTDEQKASLSMRQVKNLGVSGNTDVSKNEQKLPTANAGDITVTALTGDANKDMYNIQFSNLTLGYYLVDSSAGTMLGLTTTNPTATISAKNELPTVEKHVLRTSTTTWDKTDSKLIGDEVSYRVKIGVKPGATNYVIYDSMADGLTFGEIKKVYYSNENPTNEYIIYDASEGTAITDPTLADYFTYTEATADAPLTHNSEDCCFTIHFTDAFLNTILSRSATEGYTHTVYVEYNAELNERAVIAGAGNPNTIYLTYGENDVDVAHDTVHTFTYEMELVKHKEDKAVIQGAEFEVYKTRTLVDAAAAAVEKTEELSGIITFLETKETMTDGKEKTVYTVATSDQMSASNATTVIKAGDVIIRGLGGNFNDVGRSYFFKEIKAPEGYTLVPSSSEVKIKTGNNMAVFDETDGKYKEGGLGVENKSGTLLPSTGGIGTKIFYVVGSILLVGAAVLLITKKRMSVTK